MDNIFGSPMADNGQINKSSLSVRQLEIVTGAAKRLGVGIDNVTSAILTNGIPEVINAATVNGNFSRSIVPLYGELLSDVERSQILLDRLQQYAQGIESLAGIANQLGLQRKPELVDGQSNRVRIEDGPPSSFDPSESRRNSAGLPMGAQPNMSLNGVNPLVRFSTPTGNDTRVRILVPSGQLQGILLSGPILAPLVSTNGVLFPYTPQITVNHVADYDSVSLTHSNYAYHFYRSSNTDEISIQATFAAKNGFDAEYIVGAQHFFRTVTKMFYGQDSLAGTPPPVLRLTGHGKYQFDSVPIIVTSFSTNYPDDVDYITVDNDSGNPSNPQRGSSYANDTRVPVMQTFNITCKVIHSRTSISDEFGLAKFAKGDLLSTGSRGGFI